LGWVDGAGAIVIRVRDEAGALMLETSTQSANLTAPWQVALELPSPPPSVGGLVEVGPSTGADEHPGLVAIPVVFGTAIVPTYRSYFTYTVQPGDTLSSIASEQAPLFIGGGWQAIHEANRDVVPDPGRDPTRHDPAARLRPLSSASGRVLSGAG
jgi:hypothetical protein